MGSIPACAGEPITPGRATSLRRVYPRVCGGTAYHLLPPPHDGLSPRVRGNHRPAVHPAIRHRSIPACAGEPPPYRWRAGSPGVYPRVCGGTPLVRVFGGRIAGLSPRVRGNPPEEKEITPCPRSIPACAGEPDRGAAGGRQCGVYPRVCGGTPLRLSSAGSGQGLSPRVRGNRKWPAPPCAYFGSIPACAGEP